MLHRNMKCILLIQLIFVNQPPILQANPVASQQQRFAPGDRQRWFARRLP